MLIYYRFNNFCSFNCESEFSMSAPSGKVKKRFPDNYVETAEGFDLMKSAVIVGENAGGKSNFINSLKYLKSLFVTNSQVKSVRPYVNAASLNDKKNPVQKFELCFRSDNGKVYVYHLHLNESGIVYEELQLLKKRNVVASSLFKAEKQKGRVWFASAKEANGLSERVDKFLAGDSIGLLVSKFALLGDEDALAVVEWMTEKLYPESLASDMADDVIRQDADMHILEEQRYLEIFRMVDYSICGIELDREKPYSKTVIIRKGENGKDFRRELQMDSTGVREFFAWAVHIFRVVYENKVVFADEMDRVLNPILSDRVLAFVNGAEHKGQFIFTTHNVLHLDLKRYMKEQIYFVTKNREQLTSEMYSLSDFPEVRYEITKIYEFYMKGILGGTAFE
ncbi:MAG: ATP-binding protein [Lachnospiraceae bacterium]|nr:ATP-binding protein [Lachnospiraceae bacterium]